MTVSARGFSYLGLLFFVAITAAALAALGQAWSTAAARERERELEFRGGEIARAIASYARASTAPPGQYPARLDDLLNDRRAIKPRFHLRRAYPDPFTGLPDWVLEPVAMDATRFSGVHSRSEQPLLRNRTPDGLALERAADWHFVAVLDAPPNTVAPPPVPLPVLAPGRP